MRSNTTVLVLLLLQLDIAAAIDNSYQAVVEFTGCSADLDATQISLFEDEFVAVYNGIEELAVASASSPPTFIRRLTMVDIDEKSVAALGDATDTQRFTVLLSPCSENS